MSGMTSERLEELRRIAEAATPGPWRMDSEPEFSGPWSVGADHLPGSTVATAWAIEWSAEAAQANAQHIATFDPPTCLALLDRIEALESMLLRLYQDTVAPDTHYCQRCGINGGHVESCAMAELEELLEIEVEGNGEEEGGATDA